jgi:hypothetical protein
VAMHANASSSPNLPKSQIRVDRGRGFSVPFPGNLTNHKPKGNLWQALFP